MSIYYQKLMELMPGRIGQICALELMPSQISAFKLPGIDARLNHLNLCIGIDARSNLSNLCIGIDARSNLCIGIDAQSN